MTSAPALLLVFCDPGDRVTEAEFTDWYDNEHVPLRVDVPAFQSWRRLKAADSDSKPWAAVYDLASYKTTQEPPYTTLAETRSEREKQVLSKLKLLDRRMYELYQGAPVHPSSPKFDKKTPSPFVLFISMEVKPEAEEDFNRFYDEEHIPLLAKVPGWLRSRRFLLKDWSVTGYGVKSEDKEKRPPKYLVVTEVEHLDWRNSQEFKSLMETPWRERIMKEVITVERAVYAEYKTWERK